jgi:hypothetical protein
MIAELDVGNLLLQGYTMPNFWQPGVNDEIKVGST